jgi:hypothetical protein
MGLTIPRPRDWPPVGLRRPDDGNRGWERRGSLVFRCDDLADNRRAQHVVRTRNTDLYRASAQLTGDPPKGWRRRESNPRPRTPGVTANRARPRLKTAHRRCRIWPCEAKGRFDFASGGVPRESPRPQSSGKGREQEASTMSPQRGWRLRQAGPRRGLASGPCLSCVPALEVVQPLRADDPEPAAHVAREHEIVGRV